MAITVSTEHKTQRQDTLLVVPDDVQKGVNTRGIPAVDYDKQVLDRAISIYKTGQLQPAEARRGEDKRLILTLGFTRCDAIAALRRGFTAIDPDTGIEATFHVPEAKLWLKVVDVKPEDAFIRGIRENQDRTDVTDVQEALAQNTLRTEYGWPDTRIARLYGYSNQNRVMALKALLALPKAVQEKVHARKLSLSAALLTAKLDDESRAAVLEGATDGKNGRVDGAVVKELVRKLEEAGGSPAAESTATAKKATPAAALKRSVKDFRTFASELAVTGTAETKPVSDGVKKLFAVLVGWFDNEKTDRQLWNAITSIAE